MRERIARAALAPAAIAALLASPAAEAGLKLFTAQWYTESQGNECQGTRTPGGLPAPHCPDSFGESAKYSVFAMPQGILCNATQPRCAFSSTPTDGKGVFHPLGGPGNPTMPTSINCTPLSQYGAGVAVRPAKGQTATPRVPPLYRNPFFFTSGGQPKRTSCTAASTGYTTAAQTRFGANKGRVQLGDPVAGTWQATSTAAGGFSIPPAPLQHQAGVRTGEFSRTPRWSREFGRSGQVGEINVAYPSTSTATRTRHCETTREHSARARGRVASSSTTRRAARPT